MSVAADVASALAGRDGPLVAIALALAARLDDPDEKSPAPVAKELRATLEAIDVVMLSLKKDGDPVDDLNDRRAARRASAARGATASGS